MFVQQLGVDVTVVVSVPVFIRWLVPNRLRTLWTESRCDDNWSDIWARGPDAMKGGEEGKLLLNFLWKFNKLDVWVDKSKDSHILQMLTACGGVSTQGPSPIM